MTSALGGQGHRRRGVRVTARGRVVLVLALALLAYAAFSAGRATVAASSGASARPVVSHVTVKPGESLWTIARRVAPGQDPRETLARIVALNGLDSPTVAAGRRLTVPARG